MEFKIISLPCLSVKCFWCTLKLNVFIVYCNRANSILVVLSNGNLSETFLLFMAIW